MKALTPEEAADFAETIAAIMRSTPLSATSLDPWNALCDRLIELHSMAAAEQLPTITGRRS
jgi:hypothetical protein